MAEDTSLAGKEYRPSRDWKNWVGLAFRLTLGIVLLVAGLKKVTHLDASVLAVHAYQLIPVEFDTVVGYALPLIEIMIGLLLIVGMFTRFAALIGSLLMAAFIFAIASVWRRGISIDCGCFGGGGPISQAQALKQYPMEILRDSGLFICGFWLLIRPRSLFAIDSWLFGREEESELNLFRDEDEAEVEHAEDTPAGSEADAVVEHAEPAAADAVAPETATPVAAAAAEDAKTVVTDNTSAAAMKPEATANAETTAKKTKTKAKKKNRPAPTNQTKEKSDV